MIHDKIDIKACFVLQNGPKFISVPSLSFKKELSTILAGSPRLSQCSAVAL